VLQSVADNMPPITADHFAVAPIVCVESALGTAVEAALTVWDSIGPAASAESASADSKK
jgi:hypothetical protein